MTYDIIIIGGGTAGLTAAIYARRASKSVLLLEASVCGGQIVNTPDIENYPAEAHISGYEFASRLTEQAKALGAVIVFERAVGLRVENGLKTVDTAKNSYTARAVIVATGSANRKLGLENEDALVGRGVSYCATCDGAFFRKKTVAVVGGGSTALEDALYLSELAEKVYLIHRRETFRGEEASLQSLREKANVEFVLGARVTALHAEKRLKSIEVTTGEGESRVLEVSGLFVAVGRVPENGPFASVLPLDEAGYVKAGESCFTGVPGVFAAGDTRQKEVRQLVTAAADGASAAMGAVRYLAGLRQT